MKKLTRDLGGGHRVDALIHDNRITLRNHQHVRGVAPSGKSWSRWTTNNIYTMWIGRNGLRYARVFSKRSGWRGGAFALASAWAIMRLSHYCNEFDLSGIFPTDPWEGTKWQRMLACNGLNVAGQISDPRGVIEMIYGKNNYRKDLMREAVITSPEIMSVTVPVVGLVPMERIVEFLGCLTYAPEVGTRKTSLMLRSAHPTLANRYLPALSANAALRDKRLVVDSISLYRPGDDLAGLRNFEQVHNALVAYRNVDNAAKLARQARRLASLNKKVAAEHNQVIDGFNVPGYTIVLPEGDDLARWSIEMNNCISEYAADYAYGKATLAAVYRGKDMIGNIEVRGGHLTQLLGKYNDPLAPGDRSVIESGLAACGINVSHYWGQ